MECSRNIILSVFGKRCSMRAVVYEDKTAPLPHTTAVSADENMQGSRSTKDLEKVAFKVARTYQDGLVKTECAQ